VVAVSTARRSPVAVARRPSLGFGAWSGAPPLGERIVVVAPHPDDEVLAAGGLMRWAAEHGREVLILAVTDGEASHPASSRISRSELRRRRAVERREALVRLGIPETDVVRLQVEDFDCARFVPEIGRRLRALLRAEDTVISPTTTDRHPDHVAVAEAVVIATSGSRVERWEAPTWALVHETAEAPDRALALDAPAWDAKRHAVAAYRSQLESLGPDASDGPVVHPQELAAMLRPIEGFSGKSDRRTARKRMRHSQGTR